MTQRSKIERQRRRHLRPRVEATLALHGWRAGQWTSKGEQNAHITDGQRIVSWGGSAISCTETMLPGSPEVGWEAIPAKLFWRAAQYMRQKRLVNLDGVAP